MIVKKQDSRYHKYLYNVAEFIEKDIRLIQDEI